MLLELSQTFDWIAGFDYDFFADRVMAILGLDDAMHGSLVACAIGLEVFAQRSKKNAVLRVALGSASFGPNM